MMLSTRRSLAFSFLDRYASLAMGIVASMVLARLLTPSQVGQFSVAMVLIALLSTVRDLGAGQYLLQEKELTRDRIRAVWAVQLGVGVVLCGLVVLASEGVAAFYGEPAMIDVMLVLSANYLLNPFGSVTYAWLMREMRYDAVAIIRFSSTAVGALTAIVLASRGQGAISLAWGSACGTATTALVSVLFRPPGYPWLPGLREIRRVVSFGSKLTTSSIVAAVSAGAPEFLLGKLQGIAAAGLYSRANGLVSMFNRLVNDAVVPVVMSVFSREARESRGTGKAFVLAVSYITVLSWSFALGLALLAHPVIRLLYGDQWDQSVDPARLLAGALAFAALVPLCSAALVGVGAATQMLKATLVTGMSTVTVAAAGASWGLLPLGALLLVDAVFAAFVWLVITRPVVGFEWRELLPVLRASGVVAALSAVAPAAVLLVFGPYPHQSVLPVLLGVIGGTMGFLVGVRVTRHPLGEELQRLWPGFKVWLSMRRGN
jgi:O-antigen/teichoic acid export membrane protein